MKLFTLIWILMMGGISLYMGILSIVKGKISTISPLEWKSKSEHTLPYSIYVLTPVFLIFGALMLSLYFFA